MTQAKFPMMLDEERAKYVTREIKYELTIKDLRQQLSAAQAKIDELMLEYYPEEMTNEQIAEYEKHQRPAWRNFSLELKKEQK